MFLFPDAVIPAEYMPEGQSLHYSYTASEDSVQLFSQSRIADKLPASYDYRLILSSIKGISVLNITFLQFISWSASLNRLKTAEPEFLTVAVFHDDGVWMEFLAWLKASEPASFLTK